MKYIPWKWIAILTSILSALVAGRAAVTVGRAIYYSMQWLPKLQQDPWIYVGFASLAITIIAWVMVPRKKEPKDP